MLRIFSLEKICFCMEKTKYQCGNVHHQRYQWHASEEIEYLTMLLTNQYFCMSTLDLV